MNVIYRDSQTYIFKADKGYLIKEIMIDDKNSEKAKADGSYTFDEVTDDHTVTAVYEQGGAVGSLTWHYDAASKTLTIRGAGDIPDDYGLYAKPWMPYHNDIETIVIEDGVTSIGCQAFAGCGKLTTAFVGSDVSYIGMGAFATCNMLSAIHIPAKVTYIGSTAFSVCSSLTKITVDADNTHYCSVNGVLYNKKQFILSACPGAQTGEFVVPEGITSIGASAFCACDKLVAITLPDSLTFIGQNAFTYCSLLKSIVIPDSVTSLGMGAFASCLELGAVTISRNIASIGEYAFFDCPRLAEVTCLNPVPPRLNSSTFYKIKKCRLKVPASAVSAYKAASYWNAFEQVEGI
jgi:hypothetical protein